MLEENLVYHDAAAFLVSRSQGARHHLAISRTIVEAAKEGHLRRLMLSERTTQKPFAIRSLLPYWVGVEQWEEPDDLRSGPSARSHERWSDAAALLRRALAHASFWLSSSTPSVHDSRLLSFTDIQGLHTRFHRDAPPDFTGHLQLYRSHLAMYRDSPSLDEVRITQIALIELYLPWLAEDAELAQRVADAWNAAVERGEAWSAAKLTRLRASAGSATRKGESRSYVAVNGASSGRSSARGKPDARARRP